MPFGRQDIFQVELPSSWGSPPEIDQPWRRDEALKRQFGVELSKHFKPFNAACAVFGKDTNKALWVSVNWLNDPVVIAARDTYAQEIEQETKLLDKDALAVRLLEFSEEKSPDGRFFIHESKDRLSAYKLYAEIRGYIGTKIDIDASTKLSNNFMTIKFVKPEQEKQEMIEQDAFEKPEAEITPLPMKLKLVK